MLDFQYYTPTKVVFGRNAQQKLGALLREQNCKKVLIHYGKGSVVRSGLLDRVKKVLEEEQIAYVELGGAVPNPRLSLVYKGIELAKQEQVDFILAIGGGSAIDSAKAIGYGAADPEHGDVWDFYQRTRTITACLPIGVVLTISATGSEMSDSSVITRDADRAKRSSKSDLGRPVFAIMDPMLTMTLPDYQTASGCADILMHTMERYFVNGGNMELTDSIAEALMRTVIANAKKLVTDPADYDARAEVMWAGSLSHNGLTGCGTDGGDFVCHALEHELGGMFDVAHGAGLAAVWGSWARYVLADCLPRFRKFAVNVMGVAEDGSDEQIALQGIEAMEDFYRAIHMPTNLRELGIDPTDEQLVRMAQMCAQGCGGSKGSAKRMQEKDFLRVYRRAASVVYSDR